MAVSRILKMIWLVSFVGATVVLFYVYSSLPDMVAYSGDEVTSFEYIDRELFFYFFLIVLALLNILLYSISARKWIRSSSTQKINRLTSWKFGLGVVVNIFLVISMVFVSIFNSGEKFDYSNFGYLVYFSLALVILWVISLPFVIYSARVKV